ncbi:hypothetical protein BX661DRAFT_198441 [Kickxella alabastrina]|uniref:uncharacterized protein n=1 Tax=Kickxella alabastrina TaxID=61397 RepID=UPI00221F0AB7|nr:uncharacterized protein BX661DRAFT_198441 [Kickxella alabastrina]KAI7827867.1 hypothetical protein BX661DRAFT_198441 [Kickxella alabastrina]
MEHPIERVFSTYHEGYSFGNKGLQYDSVANTVNHIGAFDGLCLDIKVPKIRPMRELLVKAGGTKIKNCEKVPLAR